MLLSDIKNSEAEKSNNDVFDVLTVLDGGRSYVMLTAIPSTTGAYFG
jgi:hypothetical protein